MNNLHYGIIFPDLQGDEIIQVKERKVENNKLSDWKFQINKTFDSMIVFNDSLLCDIQVLGVQLSSPLFTYIHERAKTREMKKQIRYRMRALDSVVSEFQKQKAIELAEYAKQSNELLEKRKRELDIEFEKCEIEIQTAIQNKKNDYIESMKKNQIFLSILRQVQEDITESKHTLEKIRQSSSDEQYWHRREYVLMCESINQLTKQLLSILSVIL